MALDLILMTPDHQTRRVPLDGESISLGRAHDNDLCFADDASLSRKHLRFVSNDHGWWVEDLGSKNGSLLNGVRMAGAQQVKAGDRVSAGHLLISVIDPEVESSEVVFVAGEGPEALPNATVMTSLEGLLSGDATEPNQKTPLVGQAAREAERGATFSSPVVRALVRAGRELAERRPLDELFPLILDLSTQAVGAERGVVMTLEGDSLVSRAVHGEGFRISTTVRDRVLEEKTSLLVRDLQQDEAFRKQVSISEQQIHTMMAAPLQTEDRVIGLIYVDSRSFIREFTPDDLNLLTVLANVAAIRIEHERFNEMEIRERRRTEDLKQAAEIQRGILPATPPAVDGYDLAGHNEASRTVGGDYYDFISYPDGRVGVVLADVAGKGMSAALLMSNLQAMVRILAPDRSDDLAALMSRLDQSVSASCPTNRFITMFMGIVKPGEDEMVYCNAGHNPPLVVHVDGTFERLAVAGTVLGILPQLGYDEKTCSLRAGELLAVFSDGVTEAESPGGEEFGDERLAELLARHREQPSAEIVRTVLDELEEFTQGAPAADDITLVIMRRER